MQTTPLEGPFAPLPAKDEQACLARSANSSPSLNPLGFSYGAAEAVTGTLSIPESRAWSRSRGNPAMTPSTTRNELSVRRAIEESQR